MPLARRVATAALLTGLLLHPTPGEAQSRTTSALRGRVLLPTGAPAAGAAVRLVRDEAGTTRSTLTNVEGAFLILLLQPGGPYTLTVEHLGYATERREGLELRVGERTTVEVVLREEALPVEGLEVEVERADVFNAERVGPALVLDGRRIEATPLISRDLVRLTELSPLVRATDGGGFSISGQNDRYNSLLIDGVPHEDLFGLTPGGVPGAQAGARLIPLDAVDQYEVLVAPFDVRLSGFTGGVLNAVTRSGTNTVTGRASASVRTGAMTGDLSLPTGPVETGGARRQVLALSGGGPIRRDRIHLFLAGELERLDQPPPGYNLLREPSTLVRIDPERATTVAELLESEYGIEAGDPGPYDLERTVSNLFARLDATLTDRHRLTARLLHAGGGNDAPPARSAFDSYAFSSNAVRRESSTLTGSLQLFSDLGLGANEFTLSVHRSRDETRPLAPGPQIQVDVESVIEGLETVRGLRAGGEYFAQDNDLRQATVRLSNALTFRGDGGSTTVGVSGAFHDFTHRFLPAAEGHWTFPDVQSLIDNLPSRYERTVLRPGADAAIGFSVLEWGAFAQHQIATDKGLTMRFGIRVDMPRVLDRPPLEIGILDWFGPRTSYVPSGILMISPRWGFNWQSEGEQRWQVRGGVGLFTGQIPYVWLANAFHNDGSRSVSRVCQGQPGVLGVGTHPAPPFVPGTHPEGCLPWQQTGEGEPFLEESPVTVFSRRFVFPQELKFSIVADRELSNDWSLSLTTLFGHAINQVVLEEANLGTPSGAEGDTAAIHAFGGPERRRFGRPSLDGYEPNRLNPDYGSVLIVRNETQDWSFSTAVELRGSLTERLGVQAAYSYSRAYDHMSLIASDMAANYGANAIDADPNRPRSRPSSFDRPHKVVLSAFGAPIPGLPDTEVSLLYTGQSGTPFSYVYGGDLNGDGYPGRGSAFGRTNDLLYVPESTALSPMGAQGRTLLAGALREFDCLDRNRGRILPRNDCRTPWQNRLDLRLRQGLTLGGADVRLEADLVNVLNLLNGDWGQIHRVPPTVPLLDLHRRLPGLPRPLRAAWGMAVLPDRNAEGNLVPAQPWEVVQPDSQWQLQLGLSVGFGGSR